LAYSESPSRRLPQTAANQQYTTQIFETVTVHYRWHALFGQTLRVTSHAKVTAANEIVCQQPDGTRVVLPLWMLDPKCAEFVVGQRQPDGDENGHRLYLESVADFGIPIQPSTAA
jgi:hypothetical protein